MARVLELPVVPEPAKKKTLKEKRKRKKSLEKENKDTAVMHSKVQCRRQGVDQHPKAYSSLPLFTELRNTLKTQELYSEFNRFVLSSDQKATKEYPIEDDKRPGYIKLKKKIGKCDDPTSKVCCRCYETFYIRNGQYSSANSRCTYHPSPISQQQYKCCKKQYSSKGCRSKMVHVHNECDFTNFTFKKTDGKRPIRKDQELKVYALDCEMVFTTIGMEVAKISLVDIEGNTVYDNFVVPSHEVLDYNTEFSGIKPQDLTFCKVNLADAQSALLRYLNKDTILVGHALQNDLRVLRIIHEKVVDTQVVFHEGSYLKKLKVLAQEYLKKSIQDDTKKGHDSIEDARACMELMLWKIMSELKSNPRKIPPETNNSCQNAPHRNVREGSNKPVLHQNALQRNVQEGIMDLQDLVPDYPSNLNHLLNQVTLYTDRIMKKNKMLGHEWPFAKIQAENVCIFGKWHYLKDMELLKQYCIYMWRLQDHIDSVTNLLKKARHGWDWAKIEINIKANFDAKKYQIVLDPFLDFIKYHAPLLQSNRFNVVNQRIVVNCFDL